MEIIRLSPRMRAIVDWIPTGSRVVDVGTDHGYIPVWLAQTGRAASITASDINAGPLDHARISAAEYEVADRIDFELCPGLSFPHSDRHDVVVIAGMGGEMIASILAQAPWTRRGTRLILQPNSKVDVLSAWLYENEYDIQDTRLVRDGGKLYQVLLVSGGIAQIPATPGSLLVNPIYFRKKDPLLPEYLEDLIRRQERALTGLRLGKNTEGSVTEAEQLLNALQNMRKEMETW